MLVTCCSNGECDCQLPHSSSLLSLTSMLEMQELPGGEEVGQSILEEDKPFSPVRDIDNNDNYTLTYSPLTAAQFESVPCCAPAALIKLSIKCCWKLSFLLKQFQTETCHKNLASFVTKVVNLFLINFLKPV